MTNFVTSFLIFLKKDMIFHENCLPADNAHEIACLLCYFEKNKKKPEKIEFVVCCKLLVTLYGLIYSKACLKQPLKNRQSKDLNDKF